MPRYVVHLRHNRRADLELIASVSTANEADDSMLVGPDGMVWDEDVNPNLWSATCVEHFDP